MKAKSTIHVQAASISMCLHVITDNRGMANLISVSYYLSFFLTEIVLSTFIFLLTLSLSPYLVFHPYDFSLSNMDVSGSM